MAMCQHAISNSCVEDVARGNVEVVEERRDVVTAVVENFDDCGVFHKMFEG